MPIARSHRARLVLAPSEWVRPLRRNLPLLLAALVVLAGCAGQGGGAGLVEIGGAPEDLESGLLDGEESLFTATGRCGTGSAWFSGKPLHRNRVFAFDPDKLRIIATADFDSGCSALALDLVDPPSDSGQPPLLYVLITACDSQRTDASSWRKGVAVFAAHGAELKWTGILHPATAPGDDNDALTSPNSLAATRRGLVYVSNFKALCPRCGGLTPNVGNAVDADSVTDNIVLTDGGRRNGRWQVVASDVGGANGLLLSRDPGERYLYASSYHAGKVWRFTRGAQGQLTERALIFDADDKQTRTKLHGKLHPDNLSFGPAGELIVTGQRNLILAGLHVGLWRGIPARSQIVRLHLEPTPSCERDNGCALADRILQSILLPPTFSGVSEAQRVGDRYYLGHIVVDQLGIVTASGAVSGDLPTAPVSLCAIEAAQ